MNFVAQFIPDLLIIEPEILNDQRGYFTKTLTNANGWNTCRIVKIKIQNINKEK